MTFNDLEFISNMSQWNGDYCCLIGGSGQYGFLLKDYPLRVFLGIIFDREPIRPYKDYNSYEEIIADGWRVD